MIIPVFNSTNSILRVPSIPYPAKLCIVIYVFQFSRYKSISHYEFNLCSLITKEFEHLFVF